MTRTASRTTGEMLRYPRPVLVAPPAARRCCAVRWRPSRRLETSHDSGSHTIFIGAVIDIVHHTGAVLLYGQRRYATPAPRA